MKKIFPIQSLTFPLLIILMASVFFGCSSQKTTSKRVVSKKQDNAVVVEHTVSAEEYLEEAKLVSVDDSIALMIKASNQFIHEQRLAKALWISQQALTLTKNPAELNQLLLIQAEVLMLSSYVERSDNTLNEIDVAQLPTAKERLKYYSLLGSAYTQKGLKLAAAEANLHAFSLTPQINYENTMSLWLELNQLSQWEIEQLVLSNPPYVKGWQQLLNFAHRFGHDSSNFQRYLVQWQREYSQHPANEIIAQLQSNHSPQTLSHSNIAILLPLSGNQKAAGESAQQGILSAFNNAENKTLHFIDSTQLDFTELNDTLENLAVDSIIGPLLKPNVDAFLNNIHIEIPTLLLNLPTQDSLLPHHMVLSMNPADEAIQAATTLSRKNFKHPIVLSQKDKVSKRIAQNFVSQWQKITQQTPEIIYMNNGATMQKELKDSLEVSLSQSRINNIDKRIRQKIKTEARNRRDLDMIYVVGSPKETRLIKPYIDVNISPFADTIPIFASSRSHSDNADSSDSRDLTGLEFTEMPWLLTSKQQNKSLKQLHNSIWPNRSNSLKRIFAMGYDSLALIDKFSMFKEQPYIRHYGQTGILKLSNDTILTRSLLWGSYQKDMVQEIAMDQKR